MSLSRDQISWTGFFTRFEINAACESLFNLSRNQIVGRAIFDAIGHPLTTMPSDAPFAAYDIEITLPGRHRMRVDLMVAPLPDRLGWRAVSIHGHARSALGARSVDREGGTRTAVAAAAIVLISVRMSPSARRRSTATTPPSVVRSETSTSTWMPEAFRSRSAAASSRAPFLATSTRSRPRWAKRSA